MNKPLVCVVEDDRAVRRSLIVLLEDSEYETESYESAEEFLKNCDIRSLSGLVVDIRLPGISGLELLERLSDRRLPTIVITGHGDSSTLSQVMSRQEIRFMSKPFDPRKFVALVGAAIHRKGV